MFKKNIRQKFATRTLNKQNRVLFSRSPRVLADQLLVLKSINDDITGRTEASTSTIIRSSFGSDFRSR